MKTECDKNGLEYELLMQESTKERFLRQIKSNPLPFAQLGKNFVILKHKREHLADESSPKTEQAEVVVAAAAPAQEVIIVQPEEQHGEDPKVAASAPSNSEDSDSEKTSSGDSKLGGPLTLKTKSVIGKLAIAGLSDLVPKKLLLSLRERSENLPTLPTIPTFKPFTISSTAAPFSLNSLIIQPKHTLH